MTPETNAESLFRSQIEEICDETGYSKDHAFLIWTCKNILNMTDTEVDDATSIRGKNNGNIDIFYINESREISEQFVYWGQVKFTETFDYTVTEKDIEFLVKTIEHLESCPPDANSTFKRKSDEFNNIGGTNARMTKRMILVVTGKLDKDAKKLINNSFWKQVHLSHIVDPSIDLEIVDFEEILSRLVTPHTPKIQINFNGDVITREHSTTDKKSIMGYINAKEITKITKKYERILFLENPRQSLGNRTPTNQAIMSTLKDPILKKKFWQLNNGITAICDNLKESDNSSIAYDVENFKIVNGRQTTFTLERFNGSLDDVYLVLTIHESIDSNDRTLISTATNTQNLVKPVDLVTNSPELNSLVSQCRQRFPMFYFERQTKGFINEIPSIKNKITSRRVLEKNATARSYYAYEHDPSKAIMSDKDLFSAIKLEHYESVFKDRKIEDLIIPHIFMNMIKELYTKRMKELKINYADELKINYADELKREKEILSKAVVKYFILKFIYESMNSIDSSEIQDIKDKMIEIFSKLEKNDELPNVFFDIANAAYQSFMVCFNLNKKETWPEELIKKIENPMHQISDDDKPSPYDIMMALKRKKNLSTSLLEIKSSVIKQLKQDTIKNELLKLKDINLN